MSALGIKLGGWSLPSRRGGFDSKGRECTRVGCVRLRLMWSYRPGISPYRSRRRSRVRLEGPRTRRDWTLCSGCRVGAWCRQGGRGLGRGGPTNRCRFRGTGKEEFLGHFYKRTLDAHKFCVLDNICLVSDLILWNSFQLSHFEARKTFTLGRTWLWRDSK